MLTIHVYKMKSYEVTAHLNCLKCFFRMKQKGNELKLKHVMFTCFQYCN